MKEQPDGVQAEAAVAMMGGNQHTPATKRDLASVESSLTHDFENLRTELRQDVAQLRTDAILQDVRHQFESTRREFAGLLGDLRRDLRTIKWVLAAVLAIMVSITVGTIALALS